MRLEKKHNLEEMMAPGSAESGDLFDDVYIDFQVDDVFCHMNHNVYNTCFSPDDYSDDHPRCSFCE